MRKKYNSVDCNFCVSHCKIMCAKRGDNYFTIEGSGNLSGNARIEQYVMANSREIFEFHSEWIKNVCNYAAGTKRLDEV